MNDRGLLDEKDEQELHKHRLLAVEEKAFKRLTKRLLGPESLSIPRPQTVPLPLDGPPTPPADQTATTDPTSDDAATKPTDASAAARHHREHQAAQYREDLSLDFAAFDGFAWRLQFLQTANAHERARYASDALRISAECESVRLDTSLLRGRLESARATLATRRRFDELADRIATSKLLRPRADQHASLAKLDEECAELERERDSYALVWRERREQFARIVDEGVALRRLIRDEKDESDRREGMHEEDPAAAGGAAGGAAPGAAGGAATPKPDSQTATGAPPSRSGTPRPDADVMLLKPRPEGLGGLRSRSGSPSGGSPRGHESDEREEGEADDGSPAVPGGDVDMLDANRTLGVDRGDASVVGTPRIMVEQPEEGEEEDGGDRMDTT